MSELERFQAKEARALDLWVDTASREENTSEQKSDELGNLDRRLFLVCCRGLVAVKAAQTARSLWTRPLFRLRAY